MADFETVQLIGGPEDGRFMQVRPHSDTLLIPKPPDFPTVGAPTEFGARSTLAVGTYSRRLDAFEWQGWSDDPPKETP